MKLLLSFIVSFSLFSQDKIENNDLRGQEKILSIEGKGSRYFFLKSQQDEYFLKKSKNGKEEQSKISNNTFVEFDKEFVDSFINIKYMMNSSPKKCKNLYRFKRRSTKHGLHIFISKK